MGLDGSIITIVLKTDNHSVDTDLDKFVVQLPPVCSSCICDVSYFGQLQSVFLYQGFPLALGTVDIARICSKQKNLWSVMLMPWQLEGLLALIL